MVAVLVGAQAITGNTKTEKKGNIVRYLPGVIAATLLGAGTAWAAETLSAAEMRQNLLSSCFVDRNVGWVVADLGRVFHTVDGAKTWEVLKPSQDQISFVAVACPDKDHLWAAGQAGRIGYSSDGGRTWAMQTSGTARQLLDIAFVNPQRGVTVGDFGTILRTDDGGTTWTKIPMPRETKLPPDVAETVDPGDVVLYALAFPTPEHIWAVGEFGVILQSTDGGLTWRPQDSPVEMSLFGVHFADEQRGWAVGLESTLIATTDGGATWRKHEIETPRGFSLALYDVGVRGSDGWAVGNNGLLLHSQDAGTTWQLVKVPVKMGSSWFRGLSLFADGRGFIVGSQGLVLATDHDAFTPLKQQY